MFACICPFLQCKRTNRFICQTKYIRVICIITIIYLAFVSYLSSFGMPSFKKTTPTLYDILEFSHLIGSNYMLFFALALLHIKRHAHAEFFNRLNQFDRKYKKFIEPPIKYKNINRTFWIEAFLFGVYAFVKTCLKYTFQLSLFSGYALLFRLNSGLEQFIYGLALFHIKNCAHNLIVRIRKINSLLHKFLVKRQQYNATKYPMANLFRLEQTALMFIILLKAQHSLQTAFGPVFVLIFTFNLFSIAFNAYAFLSTGTEETQNEDTYATILHIFILIPNILKDFYCMINYHILGNMVSHFRSLYSKFILLLCLLESVDQF